MLEICLVPACIPNNHTVINTNQWKKASVFSVFDVYVFALTSLSLRINNTTIDSLLLRTYLEIKVSSTSCFFLVH